MSDNQTKVVVSKHGVGFCGLLFIVLLLLKVGVVETAVTGWSWWIIAMALLAAPTAIFLSFIFLWIAAVMFVLPYLILEGTIRDAIKKYKNP